MAAHLEPLQYLGAGAVPGDHPGDHLHHRQRPALDLPGVLDSLDSLGHPAFHCLCRPIPPAGAPVLEGLAALRCQHPGGILAAAGDPGALPRFLVPHPDPGAGGMRLGIDPAAGGTRGAHPAREGAHAGAPLPADAPKRAAPPAAQAGRTNPCAAACRRRGRWRDWCCCWG